MRTSSSRWSRALACTPAMLSLLAVHAAAAQNAPMPTSATLPPASDAANPYTKVSRWTPPPTSKKPITQDTYDEWRVIQGATLSQDGKWAVYTVSPVIGEGELVARSTAGTTEYRAPRGYTGRPQLQAGASGGGFNAGAAQLNASSQWVVFMQYPTRAAVDGVRGRRGAQAPSPAMAIMSLVDGKVTTIPKVRSFKLARNGGRFLAYVLEDSNGTGGQPATGGGRGGRGAGGGNPGTAAGMAPQAPGAVGDSARPAGPRREYGSTMVLRDLNDGSETRIDGVVSYDFDENERWLGYTITTREGKTDGAYVRALAAGTTTPLLASRGSYRGFAFDRKGGQVLFLADAGDTTTKPLFTLYHAALAPAKGKTVAARKLVSAADVPQGMLVAERGRAEFTRDGTAILFSLAMVPADSIPADSLADKAIYDLWHWKDTKIQPQQKVEAARDRSQSQLAIFQLSNNKWTRLGSDSLQQITVSDDGKRALALNSVEYAVQQMWGEGGSDAYLVDATTGARTLIAKKLRFGAQLSPGGGYVTWFENGQWVAHATATGKRVNLTAGIANIKFQDEEFDSPDVPPPYGIAGWTTGEKRVLIYDRFDVWEIDPAGVAAPRNMTDGDGRRSGTVFRLVDLDAEERFVDATQPLLLRAVEEASKNSGFYRDRVGADTKPERVMMAARNFGGLQKARKAEQYLMTQQTYREFPDLWTGTSIASTSRISDANPQDAQYARGTVELVSWLNTDGIPLQGLLYKPEGFDPSKKYPMVTYSYEKLSDGLHNYSAPSGRNTVNPMVYNSLGYLVFMPDIVYTDGQPGPSAAKAVIPGVQSLIAKGFVDPKRLGITGQSWGGYQSSYLVTVTNMFAAAVPNATVVNMTSAYGGIRWQSGLARSFQYEHTQSRIGGSLWEYPERFIENSPLFHLDRVTTPVLFMANDNDGSVPWYQGIEYYVAMRRLQKEAYMVVYNGDEHNPTKRANQKDIDMKMQQFFATKLLGAPAPDWMVKGIPFLEKGRDQIRSATPTIRPVPQPNQPNGGK
ncbi:MAG TPA: prolyl oligopeptidase family serine peptidase [Gemmatimonas sp.]|nr:prolyl oligopeptidase family serine peptidase [Gemmatimonas sp.]